jgi:hypothetical protein
MFCNRLCGPQRLRCCRTTGVGIARGNLRGWSVVARAWLLAVGCIQHAHVCLQQRERLDAARAAAAAAAAEEAAKAEAAHAAEVHRRMHPRSSSDFEILYNELEAWRAAETRRINSEGLDEKDRLEALAQLLHKETKLLQTIDRLKLTATKENRERRIQAVLELMSTPKLWETSTGAVTAVHTPFTTRAKELADLYSGEPSRARAARNAPSFLCNAACLCRPPNDPGRGRATGDFAARQVDGEAV